MVHAADMLTRSLPLSFQDFRRRERMSGNVKMQTFEILKDV